MVDHILLRCAFMEHTRRKDWKEGNTSDWIESLLYTDKGCAKAVAIWKEFKEARKEERRRREDWKETEDEGEEVWGDGDVVN